MFRLRNLFSSEPEISIKEELEELRSKAQTFDQVIAALDESYSYLSDAGIYINVERAMRQSTVWACVRIIGEIVGSLPIIMQERQGGAWVKTEQHDAIELIYEPNEWQTQHDLVSFLVTWAELRGNAYLFKNTLSSGKVRRLLPIESDEVEVEQLSDWRLRYSVSNFKSQGVFDPSKVFHLRNFGTSGFKGLSTIGNHRNGIGLAIQLEQHANAAYKNGLQTTKWVSTDKSISEASLAELKSQLGNYQGASNAGKIPILRGGLQLNESKGISAADAQYMESRKMQKQEIASIFGVPLFLLNDTEKSTTWGTGLEQLTRAFVKFSLDPRLDRLSQTLKRELIAKNQRRETRFIFDTTEFTLGEFKERMDGYKSGIESGVLNSNEAREIEGMNPREGGDEYRIPLNTAVEGEEQDDSDQE